jgi:preprotein translocase subunit SecB
MAEEQTRSRAQGGLASSQTAHVPRSRRRRTSVTVSRGTTKRQPAAKTAKVPQWDQAAAARVVKRVHFKNIELLGAHFERSDDRPIPQESVTDTPPDIGINVAWKHDRDSRILGCILTFGATFDQDGPYSLIAQFRLLYSIDDGEPVAESDIEHFVHWNAAFNAWPYWREYLSNTISRANLPSFLLPVMRVPIAQ